MANRYWVGGAGNWSDAANHWSDSTNGTPGAGFLPTSADNVFFDANSDGAPNVAFTVTVDTAASCADMDIGVTSGLTQTMTLAGSAALSVYGSWANATSATYTRTYSGAITFLATSTGKTITTNAVTITSGNITFNGSGGGWTLGSALTVTGTMTVTTGTFDTSSASNYALTVSALISTGTATRTINLNGSTVTVSLEGTGLNLAGSGITFNAGTSQINNSAQTPAVIIGGFTLYNLSFTSTVSSSGTIGLSGSTTTVNNLTLTSPTSQANGIRNVTISGGNITVNGTLTLGAANTYQQRVQIFSDTSGTQRTITMSGASSSVATLSHVDLRDIVFATASGSTVTLPLTGTKLGDGGNNSQITTDAAATVYWTGNTNGNFFDNRWSNSSGGAASTAYFPLAQDTMIFNEAGTPANHTVTISRPLWCGALDFSARTTAIGLATGTNAPRVFKSMTLSAAVTLSGTTGGFRFAQSAGSQTIDITPAGVAFTQNLTVETNPTTSVRLLANVTNSDTARSVTLTSGKLDLNTYTLSYGLFATSGSITRELAFGTNGKFTLSGSGATAWSASGSGFTTSGSGTIDMTSASAKTFAGGGFTYAATINQGGAGALTLSGSNTFNSFSNTTQPATVTFTSATTTTFTSGFALSGTSGNLITINSSSAGSVATLAFNSGTINVSYCSIRDSAARGVSALAYYSNGNTNVSGNTGWLFTPVTNSSGFMGFFV